MSPINDPHAACVRRLTQLFSRQYPADLALVSVQNPIRIERYDEPLGFFGFFESIDDAAVAGGLLDAARQWLGAEGLPVMRGPLIYCLESPDQQAVSVSLFDMELTRPAEPFKQEFRRDLLDGVMVLQHTGRAAEKPLENEPLYQIAAKVSRSATKPIELTFIPYYAWANRGLTSMEVWVPLK